jgi:hypothetical protein
VAVVLHVPVRHRTAHLSLGRGAHTQVTISAELTRLLSLVPSRFAFRSSSSNSRCCFPFSLSSPLRCVVTNLVF